MTAPRTIRVVLADDHAIVLEGLKALVDGERDMKVVGATTDGAKVLALVDQVAPDVVLLDLELSGIRGTDILADLRKRPTSPKVLVLTAYNDGESIRAALDAGADGLALKTEPPQQTIAAIRQVCAGQLVFPQAARRWLDDRLSGSATGGGGGGAPGELTAREREVWSLIAAGLSNGAIAKRLSLSANTVKFHVQHLFSKLGVKNRTEAALRFAHSRSVR
jgi:DNA-binding NarL/FixJ family response regulator